MIMRMGNGFYADTEHEVVIETMVKLTVKLMARLNEQEKRSDFGGPVTREVFDFFGVELPEVVLDFT